MPNIYFFSGPCGCGKSTLAEAFAKKLVNSKERKQIYLIHGDDFCEGFVEADDAGAFFSGGQPSDALAWQEILKFNWECLLDVARKALARGLDVVIDYVIEEELPLVQKMAKEYDANLYYIVLTASEKAIRQRITNRGDVEMIERAMFLKNKLEKMPQNQGHLFDNTDMSVAEEVANLDVSEFQVREG